MNKDLLKALKDVEKNLAERRGKLGTIRDRMIAAKDEVSRLAVEITEAEKQKAEALRRLAEGETSESALDVIRKRLSSLVTKRGEIAENLTAFEIAASRTKGEIDSLQSRREGAEKALWLSVAEEAKRELRQHVPEILKAAAAYRLADRNYLHPKAFVELFFGPENGFVHSSPSIDDLKPYEEELRKAL